MRTDHVSAWLMREWLQSHTPDLVHNWNLEVSDDVKAFAERFKAIIPSAPLQLVGQHMVARTVIERWGLKNVALLAGGTPTPLSPKPEQILYFTDANPEATAEAQAAGYKAVRVNVTNPDDLKQLDGAKTAIATGLFHFLPDPAAQGMFNNLSEAGFETIIFTHANKDTNPEFVAAYDKFGVKFFLRSVDDVRGLLPANWRIDEAVAGPDLLQYAPEVGSHLAGLPRLMDIYRVTCQ